MKRTEVKITTVFGFKIKTCPRCNGEPFKDWRGCSHCQATGSIFIDNEKEKSNPERNNQFK